MKIRNGADYLQSLQDGREIWLNGKRINNVTDCAQFKGTLTSIASSYDLKNKDEYEKSLKVQSETNVEIPVYYRIPRNAEDLVALRRGIEIYCEAISGGFMDRLPEAVASALFPMLIAVSGEIGKTNKSYEENIRNFHSYCAENDILACFSRADPRGDRSKGPLEQDDPDLTLRIVEKTSGGLIVRGAKHTATPAPFAHEIIVIPGAPYRSEREGQYSLCFSVPISTKGVKVVCREPAAPEGGNQDDNPLGSRFDEIDGFVIFDDVLVPWERVFIGGEVNLTTGATWQNQELRSWAGFNYLIKAAMKTKLLIGATYLLSEWNGTNMFPATREGVADILMYMANIRSHITAAQLTPKSFNGIAMPNPEAILSGRWYAIKNYHSMINLVEDVCGVQMDVSPSITDLGGPLGPTIEKYFSWKGVRGKERLKLLKFLGDLAVTRFAGHKELFQYYSEGVSYFNRMGLYNIYDFKECVDSVNKFANLQRI